MRRNAAVANVVVAIVAVAATGVAWGQATRPAAGQLETQGKIDAVTVYRGQALVTRLVEVEGAAGLREVVVTDLPNAVVPGSIYAESADGVEVRSVTYRTRPVSEDVRDEVRKLDADIRAVQDKIEANAKHVALLAEQRAYLAKLEAFVAPTATVELSKGVLNADTLKQLSSYLLEQRQTLTDEELKRGVEARELQQQMELLGRQRQELTAGSARTVREAVVFVNLQGAARHGLRVRYLVDNANWTPSYNVRSESEKKDVQVEYHASVQQMSGEDWKDVAMTLSTATPSLVAKAPLLTPLTVALTAPPPPNAPAQQVAAGKDYQSALGELKKKQSQVETARSNTVLNFNVQVQSKEGQPQQPAQPPAVQVDNDLGLNAVANEMQILDLVSMGNVDNRAKATRPAVVDEGVSVTYQLAGRIALPSRSDQQLIEIASLPMKAEFYKLATPVLTSYVYNEAVVTNTSSMVLLAGPMSAYLRGEFVGHADVPTVAIGESFTAGFGIDSSLRAGRELMEKTESVQGGNRTVNFTYRLSIENFGSAPAKVRMLDRLPVAKDNEVRVELVSAGEVKLSEDSRYLQTERKKGILRWEVEAPAQAIGPQAFGLEYKLRLEYDKQMHIAGMPMAAK
jgi:hypothetical protein